MSAIKKKQLDESSMIFSHNTTMSVTPMDRSASTTARKSTKDENNNTSRSIIISQGLKQKHQVISNKNEQLGEKTIEKKEIQVQIAKLKKDILQMQK